MKDNWYTIDNIELIDSPSFVVYLNRVRHNIATLKKMVPDVDRLRPHVKTHKSREITTLLLEEGIHKFKCATIAEAEMLALADAPDVLLAYQPIGPKIERLAKLILEYPNTTFSCLIDNEKSAQDINSLMQSINHCLPFYLDVDVGMHRTGMNSEDVVNLYNTLSTMEGLLFMGLHAYDGHLRYTDIKIREQKCNEAFQKIEKAKEQLIRQGVEEIIAIAGGSPTFPIHAKRKDVECSPGTFIYWDKGYSQNLPEQDFLPAAVVISRVISKPTSDTICIDLGHKAIASENVLQKRVSFLNAEGAEPIGHSEEHMVLKVTGKASYEVGDVIYGIPYHVCPTCALYDTTVAVDNGRIITQWKNISRDRTINY